MLKQSLAIALVAAGIGLLAPCAHAQFAPMDMSSAVQRQMQLWNQGEAAARSTAMNFFLINQYRRSQGLPPLPAGVTPESLRRSIEAANRAAAAYNDAQFANSQRRSNAIGDYAWRGIRGCTYVSPYQYWCPQQ